MSDTVVVASFRTRAEAELAALPLQGAGIPYLIQSAEGMMHGPFSPGARILVPTSAENAARELLADVTAPPERRPRRGVALGTYSEHEMRQIVARLDEASVPWVVEHPDGEPTRHTVYVRREHQLPARRALERRA